jgi:hypothetical protein
MRQPHQIRPADADVNIARYIQPAHFTAEVFAAVNQTARHNAVRKNAASQWVCELRHIVCVLLILGFFYS